MQQNAIGQTDWAHALFAFANTPVIFDFYVVAVCCLSLRFLFDGITKALNENGLPLFIAQTDLVFITVGMLALTIKLNMN